MRKIVPSSYDPRLTSEDVRTFKRLLRGTPGVPQTIKNARWVDENHARVWAGGSTPGGCLIEFVRVEGSWRLSEYSYYIA